MVRIANVRSNADGVFLDGKRLECLTQEAAEGLELLGTAAGMNIGHCIYLGIRYEAGFKDRVIGYQIIEDDPLLTECKDHLKGLPAVAVAFYARPHE